MICTCYCRNPRIYIVYLLFKIYILRCLHNSSRGVNNDSGLFRTEETRIDPIYQQILFRIAHIERDILHLDETVQTLAFPFPYSIRGLLVGVLVIQTMQAVHLPYGPFLPCIHIGPSSQNSKSSVHGIKVRASWFIPKYRLQRLQKTF